MWVAIDLSGKRFGRLFVLERDANKNPDRVVRWICLCDCGNICIVRSRSLRVKDTTSCGCFHKEVTGESHRVHGLSRETTPEYRAWKAMKKRCYNTNYEHYSDYGGRGISVCDRWLHSFKNFLIDMGIRPSDGHSLDRYPNKNGNYEPGNCRWATKQEQSNNRRNNVIIEFNGVSLTLSGWAKRFGVNQSNLRQTLKVKPFDRVYKYYTNR